MEKLKASDVLLKSLRSREALRLRAYPDPGSRDGSPWTIGWGTTTYEDGSPVRQGDEITEERAEQLFRYHVGVTEDVIGKHVLVPLAQTQFDALVSFVYNIGAAQFASSTLLKRLNARDYAGAASQFERWIYNDGKVLEELVNRRKWEQGLFTTNVPPPVATVPPSPAGRSMNPFVIPALNALVELIPTLGKLFKGSSPSAVAERNVAAVEAVADKVLPIVLGTTGASNAQAAVEIIQSNPAMVQQVDQALKENYMELQEAVERSRSEARKFVMEYQQGDQKVRTVLGKFTFIEVLSMAFLLWGMAGSGIVLYGGQEKYGAELIGLIVGGMIVVGVAAVREFWLGSSSDSQRKTDYLINSRGD